MTQCFEGARPATVVRRNQYDQKNMFVIFFRTTGPELFHMVESGNSITGAYYKDNCRKPLFNNIIRQRPNCGKHAIKLHHDNTSSRQTKDIKTFLQDNQKIISVILSKQQKHQLSEQRFFLIKTAKSILALYERTEKCAFYYKQ